MAVASQLDRVPPSLVRNLFDKASAMKDVINLSIGEPDFETPSHIREAAIEALACGLTRYTPTRGTPELREAVSEKLWKENNIRATPDEVLITVSANQALLFSFASLFREGDVVLIQSPMFVSYAPQVIIAGGTPIEVKTDEEEGFMLTGEEVQEHITPRTKALIINSPSNPTGSVIRRRAMEEIADISRQEKITVISDEIYERLVYEGTHTSLAALDDMKDLVITINGFSKSYAMTGWRLGYVIAPKAVMERMVKLTMYSTACAPAFVQVAGARALSSSQKCIEDMKHEYNKRRLFFTKRLNEIEGISVMMPEGAFYVFANVAATGMDGTQFGNVMLDAGVVVVPGIAFGDWRNHVRMSYAVNQERLEQACERMEGALRNR